MECQLVSILLNHLSIVKQSTDKHVGCNRCYVLYVNTNFLQHYILSPLYNLYFFFNAIKIVPCE